MGVAFWQSWRCQAHVDCLLVPMDLAGLVWTVYLSHMDCVWLLQCCVATGRKPVKLGDSWPGPSQRKPDDPGVGEKYPRSI